jgi:hypothetical protein
MPAVVRRPWQDRASPAPRTAGCSRAPRTAEWCPRRAPRRGPLRRAAGGSRRRPAHRRPPARRIVSDDHRDGFAGEPDLVTGERVVGGSCAREQRREVGQVICRPHPGDACDLPGLVPVDRHYPGMRMRAPHAAHARQSREHDVGDPPGPTGQRPVVLPPAPGSAQHKVPPRPPRRPHRSPETGAAIRPLPRVVPASSPRRPRVVPASSPRRPRVAPTHRGRRSQGFRKAGSAPVAPPSTRDLNSMSPRAARPARGERPGDSAAR